MLQKQKKNLTNGIFMASNYCVVTQTKTPFSKVNKLLMLIKLFRFL